MRFFLLLVALLFPQLLWAQFNEFYDGSYVLANNPTTRYQTMLRIRDAHQIVVKQPDGKKTKLSPEQVSSFRIGRQKYIAVKGFTISGTWSDTQVKHAFVEQLDSGRVTLLRYENTVSSLMMIGANGGMSGGMASTQTIYFLRKAQDPTLYSISSNGWTGAGKQFREDLLPHLTSRPDLIKLVEGKTISVNELPFIVRALNSGLAYRDLATPTN
ncbi:hypothetical protein I2I05_07095 [Hymenobacter sp. BT683]|uniref:Uncharacterized protein n=1 Tax=Hymenobacter jeongseonensis TaxID=2791027 RepID=A0ABS0IGU9_9BACT|nr:hypothetical protein [Hymenobacter jeongseonensis]MBF9237158.1 hypothetical protein [Hymenobacter jeongseonensis]